MTHLLRPATGQGAFYSRFTAVPLAVTISIDFTTDAGARYAFAPSSEPTEGVVHRIRIVFQTSDGRVWTTGTDMMAPTIESAEDFCDALNARLGLDREG